jgi:hypothetical protein
MLYVEHTRNWPFTYVQSGAHRFLFVTCAQPAGCGEPGHTHAFDAPVYVFVAANPFGQTTPASVHFVRSIDVLIEIPTAVAACARGSIPLLERQRAHDAPKSQYLPAPSLQIVGSCTTGRAY